MVPKWTWFLVAVSTLSLLGMAASYYMDRRWREQLLGMLLVDEL